MNITDYAIHKTGAFTRIEFHVEGPLGMTARYVAWPPTKPDDPTSEIRITQGDGRGGSKPAAADDRPQVIALIEAHPVLGPAALALGFLPAPSESEPHYRSGTWKYAEEHAKDLVDNDRLVSITMEPDVAHHDEEDGNTYVYDEFLVHDLGPRP